MDISTDAYSPNLVVRVLDVAAISVLDPGEPADVTGEQHSLLLPKPELLPLCDALLFDLLHTPIKYTV